jgi:hypothetical protein
VSSSTVKGRSRKSREKEDKSSHGIGIALNSKLHHSLFPMTDNKSSIKTPIP